MDELKVIPPIVVEGPSIGTLYETLSAIHHMISDWLVQPQEQIMLASEMRDLALYPNQALRLW